MASAEDLRDLALRLEGTIAYPHFDRTAFKAARTFVTLAGDGQTANFLLSPEEQALKCEVRSEAFSALAKSWGRKGWTAVVLRELTTAELDQLLRAAWENGRKKRL